MTLLMSTERDGIIKTMQMLERIGFFKAPASSKFPLNYEGGLLEHSINVFDMARDIREVLIKRNPDMEEKLPVDSVILAALPRFPRVPDVRGRGGGCERRNPVDARPVPLLHR